MVYSEQRFDNYLGIIAKTSLFIFAGLMFSKIASYVYRIIIARYFGAELYGSFAIALMISGWFITLAALGLNHGIIRYVAAYRGKKEYNKIKFIFLKSVSISIIMGLIFMFIMFFSADFISQNIFNNFSLTYMLKLFSVVVPITILMNLLLGLLNAYERVAWQSSIVHIFNNGVKVSSILIFLFLGFKAISLPLSYSLGILVSVLVSYIVIKKNTSSALGHYKLEKKTKKKIWTNLLSYSWPFIFSSIVLSIFYWTDSFMVGYFLSVEHVGFYNAAVPIALLLTLAPELFIGIFFPLINKEYSNKNMQMIRELSKQVGKWIFILNLPVFLIMFLFPGLIINSLFGSDYLVAENTLRILSIGAFFSSLIIISQKLLEMSGRSKTILVDTMMVGILNIILNYLLVPQYGINGAAIATTISVVILHGLFLFQVSKSLSIIPLRRKIFIILLISAIPMSIVLYARSIVEVNLISISAISILFFLIYIFLIFITKSFDKNDVYVINLFLKKLKFSPIGAT